MTSNAWLEVKYGKTLQKFILSHNCGLRYVEVIFRGGGRLWKQIGINTVIFIAEKKKEEQNNLEGIFSRSRVDFFEIPYSSLKKGIIPRKNWSDNYYNTQVIEKRILDKTNKWAGTFLRTSKAERLLIEKISRIGIPLSGIADVKFGIKSGANDFFHVKIDPKKPLEKGAHFVRNKLGFEGYIENKYLLPIIKSPLEVEGFVIKRNFSPKLWVFFCNESMKKLRNTKAFEYISWAESTPVVIKQGKLSDHTILGFSSLPSVKKRALWYSLGFFSPPDLLWTKSYHTRPGCFLNTSLVLADQRFYSIIMKKKEYIPLVFIFLNSSFVWAQMEIQGNTNLGFGALDTNVYWLKSLRIPIGALKDANRAQSLAKLLNKAKKRYSMLKSSRIRRLIDQYFAEYYGLNNNDLMRLNSFIVRTLSNRVNLSSSE